MHYSQVHKPKQFVLDALVILPEMCECIPLWLFRDLRNCSWLWVTQLKLYLRITGAFPMSYAIFPSRRCFQYLLAFAFYSALLDDVKVALIMEATLHLPLCVFHVLPISNKAFPRRSRERLTRLLSKHISKQRNSPPLPMVTSLSPLPPLSSCFSSFD